MKKPKPRDYGLDSDHFTVYAGNLDADPAQPFTQEELNEALDALLFERALKTRQAKYAAAVSEDEYRNSWR